MATTSTEGKAEKDALLPSKSDRSSPAEAEGAREPTSNRSSEKTATSNKTDETSNKAKQGNEPSRRSVRDKPKQPPFYSWARIRGYFSWDCFHSYLECLIFLGSVWLVLLALWIPFVYAINYFYARPSYAGLDGFNRIPKLCLYPSKNMTDRVPWFRYDASDKMVRDKNHENITDTFLKYIREPLEKGGYTNHSDAKPCTRRREFLNASRPCNIDLRNGDNKTGFGPCAKYLRDYTNDTHMFGFADDAPCFLLRLNEVYDFVPNVPDDDEVSRFRLAKCEIQPEKGATVEVYPKEGYPLAYYPFVGRNKNQQPIYAVQVNLTPEDTVTVICKSCGVIDSTCNAQDIQKTYQAHFKVEIKGPTSASSAAPKQK